MAVKIRLLTKVSFSSIYTCIIALLPIISMLKSPVSIMNLGTFIVLAISPLIVIDNLKHRNETTGIQSLKYYLIYISLYSIVVYFTKNYINSIIASLYMTVLCLLSIYLGLRNSFRINLFRKIVENVSVIASLVVITQQVIYILQGITFPIIPQELIYEQNSFRSATAFAGGLPRCCAFFIEPSHFAQYVIIGIISFLFPSSKREKNLSAALICSIGMMLTISGIGLLVTGIVWVYWLFLRKHEFVQSRMLNCIVNSIIIIVFAVIVLALGMQFEFTRVAVQRILGLNGLDNAYVGRLWSYNLYANLGLFEKIFGVGYGMTSEYYMTSIVSNLYTIGIVGTLIISFGVLYLYKHTKDFYRCTIIIFSVLFYTALIFTQMGVVFYYSVIISGTKKRIYHAYHLD